MKELIVLLRAAQIYAHNAHNLCGRVPFFSDHAFLAETYAQLDTDYDSCVERYIGITGQELDLNEILQMATELMMHLPTLGKDENSDFFRALLELEKEICHLIEQLCSSGVSIGTEQMVGDIANLSEMRQYKIKQRLK